MAPRPGPQPTGGVETGVGLLLESPLAARHRIRVWDRTPPPGPRPALPLRLARRAMEFARFAGWIALRRPEVVHIKSSSGVNFAESAIYVAVSRALGRRTLLQLHSGEFATWYDRQSAAGRWAVRCGLRCASEILVLSEYCRRQIQPLAGDRRIYVLPNGVQAPARLAARGRNGGPLQVLTIAALGRPKGHFDILEAADLLRERPIRFLFAGPAADEGVSRRVRELNLQSSVRLLGPVGPRQKWELLAQSDVFLLASHAEGMPNAVLEAMAVGLPVVATKVGAIPEMLGGGSGGRLIEVGDVAGLARTLVELEENPALRRMMGEWNRQRVEACYCMDRVLALLDALYAERAS